MPGIWRWKQTADTGQRVDQRIFLPAHQGQDIAIFEYRSIDAQARREFLLVARGTSPDTLRPTGVVDMDADQMARVRDMASALTHLSLPQDLSVIHADAPARALDQFQGDSAFAENSTLTYCLYLELQRFLSVAEQATRRYEAQAPADRVTPGLTGSVYEGLLKLDALDRAQSLLDQDAAQFPTPARDREWSYVFTLAASICARRKERAPAARYLRQAFDAAPDPRILHRLAHLHAAEDRYADAAAALVESHAHTPLTAAQARRLSWWFVEMGDGGTARTWYDYARANGADAMPKLKVRIDDLTGDDEG